MNLDRIKYRYWERETWNDPKSPLVARYTDIVAGCDPTVAVSDFEFCTGLKDKRGNLIYENDVLFDDEFCGVVIWKDSCWMVEMTLYDGDKSYEHLDQHFAKYGAIIGNVHEYKE